MVSFGAIKYVKMEILKSSAALIAWRNQCQSSSIGFVPTMGALHPGHLSLMIKSKIDNDKTLASIFVNPTQFNDPKDFLHYPNSIDADIKMLEELEIDAVFIPDVADMYPEVTLENFHIPILTESLEAKMRPGHFDGVITIIRKLFDLAQAHHVYLGEKDFQQLSIISAWVKKEKRSEIIVPCPTHREASGLAMSSRNQRLQPSQLTEATLLFQILNTVKENKFNNTPVEWELWARSRFAQSPAFRLDYFEIIDADTFGPIAAWEDSQKPIAVVAAFLGEIRLIDNMRL
jgi:pantoate--beta-alanine ligase